MKLLVFLFAFMILSCSDKESSKVKLDRLTTRQVTKGSKKYDEMFWKDYNRIISLTSNKYGIKESDTRDIILEYLRINQPGEYFILTLDWPDRDTTIWEHNLVPSESINETIRKLSSKYNVGKDTLNQLLFDFELWCNTMKIENK